MFKLYPYKSFGPLFLNNSGDVKEQSSSYILKSSHLSYDTEVHFKDGSTIWRVFHVINPNIIYTSRFFL